MSFISVEMSEVLKVKGGYAFKSKDFEEKGTPIIRISNIHNDTVDISNAARISSNKAKKGDAFRVYSGDILMAMSGATTGKLGILPSFIVEKIYLNQRVGHFIPDEQKIHHKFLWFFLRSPECQSQINTMAEGAAQPNISGSQLESIKIPLPPLKTQKYIASVLEKADQLRKDCQRLEQELNQLAQSVFIEMFGDPVTNPKGWETRYFSELGELARGKSKHRPRNDPILLGGKYPLIQTGDVARAKNHITKYKATYSEEGLKQSKLWNKGTLCITIAANIADTAILDFDACFPDSVVGFIANEELVLTEFIHYWLIFYQKVLRDLAPESAQKNINLKILGSLEICVPPVEKQIEFLKLLEALDLNKNNIFEESKELDSLFNALSQKAFKGELKAPT